MISGDVAAFLQQGLSLHIGVRNERLQPEGARAVAARLDHDRRHLVVYIAQVAADRILPHLEDNGHAAVAFARPVDDRACQVKGTVVEVRRATDDEREYVLGQWNGLLDQLEQIGIPRRVSTGWATWPAIAIRLKITAVFDQTPGSQAGTQIV
jgi:hypothetical protein